MREKEKTEKLRKTKPRERQGTSKREVRENEQEKEKVQRRKNVRQGTRTVEQTE